MENKQMEQIGDHHISTNIATPLRADAFDQSDESKIKSIQGHFENIMNDLGLDLTDDSLSGTPYRVAKMYVKELFYGLNPKNKPKLSTFENKYGYGKMLLQQNINIDSACEHHFLPIIGHAHIAYVPKDRVIGLSKINRIVDYYSRRPQVQERLCLQIKDELMTVLGTEDVMVVVHAKHLCVSSRGIKDKSSFVTTVDYAGCFNKLKFRQEFYASLEGKHIE